MNNRSLAIVLALALCLSLAGCSGEPAAVNTDGPAATEPAASPSPSPVETPQPTDVGEESVEPDISVLMTPLIEMRDDGGVLVFSGYYSEPVVKISGRDAAAEKITKELAKKLASGGTEADEMYEEACEHYEGLTEEQQSIWFSYSLSRMGEVKRGDGAVLSVLGSDYVFTGGTHGSNSYYGMSFDSASGAKLALRDIFSDTATLSAKVEASVLAQVEQLENPEEFSGVREFVEEALEGDGWYLSTEGLELIAAEGEIASTARGPITFVIPYAELEELIEPEYLPAEATEGAKDVSAFSLSFEKPSEPLVEVKLDREADTFYLSANEDTAAFTFCNVNFGGKFYVAVGDEPAEDGYAPGRGYLWLSGLKAGECIAVTGYFNDTPNFGIQFDDGSLLILAQSGKDSSLLIYEAE